MSSKTKNDEKDLLRKKAEEKLRRKYDYLKDRNSGPITKDTEELWIHQIELEMQNEEIRKTQTELEEAKRKYTDLFDFAPVGYFIINKDSIILDANLTGARLVGVERISLVGKPLPPFIKKECLDFYYSKLRKAFVQKTAQRCEIKIIEKTKASEFDAEILFEPIIGKSEKIENCRIAIIDITSRKQLEEEIIKNREELEKRVEEKTADLLEVVELLRKEIEQRKQADIELQKRTKELEQSEKKYRTLVEVSPDAICVAVDDKVVFVNNTAVKLFNANKADELKGKSIWEFVHPDSVKIIQNRLEKFGQGKKQIEVIEVKLIRTDGSFFDAGGTAAIVDYEGKPGILIIFQDISIRKRQEASIKKIKSRLIEAQRIAHIGNWDWDIKNNLFWLSDESFRIFGIDQGSFDGNFEGICKLVHPDDRQHVKDINDNAIKECKSFSLEFRIIRPDGLIRHIHKRAETECIEGKPVRLVGTIQDITEQKKAENQIILSRQKLRTLAAKMEMIEEQERRRIASDLHDSVGQILAFATRELKYMRKNMPKQYGDSLLEIAEQLDKAVVQTRTLSFDLSPSILYDIGFEIAVEDMLEKVCAEQKLKCCFENDEKPKPLSIPIKVLLYRSIRELLMNIAKHAKARHINVRLSREDDNIEVIVEDDGKGFDVGEIDGGKTKGFGLFNIRERIEHLGGKFMIESGKGKGTKTRLTVPLSFRMGQSNV